MPSDDLMKMLNDAAEQEQQMKAAALEAGKNFAQKHELDPARSVDPNALWYKAALAFAEGASGGAKFRYLSQYTDRFAVVGDFAVFNSQGQMLMGLRSKNVQHSGKWCTPGGHMEDELSRPSDLSWWDFYHKMAHELHDETGLWFDDTELAKRVEFVWAYQGDYHGERDKRFLQVVFAVFPSQEQLDSELKKSTNEMDALQFFDVAELISSPRDVELAFPDIQLSWLRKLHQSKLLERRQQLQDTLQGLKKGRLISEAEFNFLSTLRV